jgi:hypothetical protein
VNLKTPEALGLTIPQSVPARADDLIQKSVASNESNCVRGRLVSSPRSGQM